MPVNVLQWRAGIGNFYKCTHPQVKIKYGFPFSLSIRIVLSAFFHNLFCQICLVRHGYIELNPGPNKNFKPLNCCHWNVNSLTAHKMLKESSIEAYNAIHDYDFTICISETYLNSSVSLDDNAIAIEATILSVLIISAITKRWCMHLL